MQAPQFRCQLGFIFVNSMLLYTWLEAFLCTAVHGIGKSWQMMSSEHSFRWKFWRLSFRVWFQKSESEIDSGGQNFQLYFCNQTLPKSWWFYTCAQSNVDLYTFKCTTGTCFRSALMFSSTHIFRVEVVQYISFTYLSQYSCSYLPRSERTE